MPLSSTLRAPLGAMDSRGIGRLVRGRDRQIKQVTTRGEREISSAAVTGAQKV